MQNEAKQLRQLQQQLMHQQAEMGAKRADVKVGNAVLCCAVLCCAVLCCAVLCCAVLCYGVLCWTGYCIRPYLLHCPWR